ncbi:MAG: GNAT family N-acetyltransferase [Pseudomonadota bacterium]
MGYKQQHAFRIRRANSRDAHKLSDIGTLTFTQTFGALYSTKNLTTFLKQKHTPKYFQTLLNDPNCAAWLVENDGLRVTGYAVAGPTILPIPNVPVQSGELIHIYIRSGAQRMGLGAQLIEVVLSWMHANFEHLYVGVFSENFGAQRFYQRYGFQKIHEYTYMVGDHADAEWIMKQVPTGKR